MNYFKILTIIIITIMIFSACTFVPDATPTEPYTNFTEDENKDLIKCMPNEYSFADVVKSSVVPDELTDFYYNFVQSNKTFPSIENVNDFQKIEYLKEIPDDKDFAGRYAGVRFKYLAVFRTDSDSFLILMFLDNRALDLWFELKQTNLSSDKFEKSENFFDISDVKSIDPDGKFPLEPDAFSSSVHLTNDGYLIYVFYDYNEAENDLIIKDIGKLRI